MATEEVFRPVLGPDVKGPLLNVAIAVNADFSGPWLHSSSKIFSHILPEDQPCFVGLSSFSSRSTVKVCKCCSELKLLELQTQQRIKFVSSFLLLSMLWWN